VQYYSFRRNWQHRNIATCQHNSLPLILKLLTTSEAIGELSLRSFLLSLKSAKPALRSSSHTRAPSTAQKIPGNEGQRHRCVPYGSSRLGRVHGSRGAELDRDRYYPGLRDLHPYCVPFSDLHQQNCCRIRKLQGRDSHFHHNRLR
jgi:hypothetical protein